MAGMFLRGLPENQPGKGEIVKGWFDVPGSMALVFSYVHGCALMERPDSKSR